jgi:hypothetical protein
MHVNTNWKCLTVRGGMWHIEWGTGGGGGYNGKRLLGFVRVSKWFV